MDGEASTRGGHSAGRADSGYLAWTYCQKMVWQAWIDPQDGRRGLKRCKREESVCQFAGWSVLMAAVPMTCSFRAEVSATSGNQTRKYCHFRLATFVDNFNRHAKMRACATSDEGVGFISRTTLSGFPLHASGLVVLLRSRWRLNAVSRVPELQARKGILCVQLWASGFPIGHSEEVVGPHGCKVVCPLINLHFLRASLRLTRPRHLDFLHREQISRPPKSSSS